MIDREQERALLEQAMAELPQFVVMTGRRRVGKSYLLNEVITGPRVVSYQGNQLDETGQLEFLAIEAARLLNISARITFTSWDDALSLFENEAIKEPIILMLDEFQLLCAANPALPSIIQRHWDHWSRKKIPIGIVLCGSALSFMRGLLDYSEPLYGRAGYRPVIQPLDYRWASKFTTQTDASELLRRFAILGGIPQYQVWGGEGSIKKLISDRILRKGTTLYEEPRHLIHEEQDIRDPGSYFGIMQAIASGATQTNQIATRSHLQVSNVSRRLDVLQKLGYVELREPLEPHGKGKNRSRFAIADPFFRFWFRYVFKQISSLERGDIESVADRIMSDLDNYMGIAFEDCCRAWVGYYAPTSIVGTIGHLGSWWSRKGDAEIDIVSVHDGKYTFLGSVKWRQTVDEPVLDQLYEHRVRLGPTAANSKLAVFARNGFTPNLITRARDEGVELVTAADLFA